MDPEQFNASLVWFALSIWLTLALTTALYFGLQLFMDQDAAGGRTLLIGIFSILPVSFIFTMPYALGISRAYFGFWDRRDRRLRNRQ